MAITRSTLQLLRRLQVAIGTAADAAVRSLTHAWTRSWDELSSAWQSGLSDTVAQAAARGQWPSVWELARVERLRQASIASEEALLKLGSEAGIIVRDGAGNIIQATARAEPHLIASQLPAAAQAGAAARAGATMTPSALSAIVARSQAQIVSAVRPLSGVASEAMRRELIKGIAVGDNPRRAAGAMVSRVQGAFEGGLVRATTIARTEMLDAYRATSTLAHTANADVVSGWIWHAQLDSRTCFPAGTLVVTRRGEVPIEAVRVGDEVLTHLGRWRRVYETMARPYVGRMVTAEAGPLRVSATADHPFLVERQGELNWVKAGELRRGDSVFSDRESGADRGNHRLGEVAVERRRHQPDDRISTALQEERLFGVAGNHFGVPVRFVDLKGDAVEQEVDGALPSGDRAFLLEGHAQGFEAEPDVAFGFGLSGVPPIAAHAAELRPAGRDDADTLAASQAIDLNGRPAALFGAVDVLSTMDREDLAAPGAWLVAGVHGGASPGTDYVSVSIAAGHRELPPAADASLRYAAGCVEALLRAELSGTQRTGLHIGTAALAGDNHRWPSRKSSATVGMLALVCGVAALPAESAATFAHPGRGDLELGAATVAGSFHRHIVSNVESQTQTTIVYNLEVDEDHTYVADGFVVHNCPSCWSMHGTVHPADQPGPWDHPQGRCARLPKTRTWRELGFDIDEPDDTIVNARARFFSLPDVDQRTIMGPGRLALLRSGRVDWSDISMLRPSTGWRPSYAPRTVFDLERVARLRAAGGRVPELSVPPVKVRVTTPPAPDLIGVRGLSADPAVREVQLANRALEAFRDAPVGLYGTARKSPADWVMLSDIRAHQLMASLSRAEQDEALRAILAVSRREGRSFALAPLDNTRALTVAQRKATLELAPNHPDPSLRLPRHMMSAGRDDSLEPFPLPSQRFVPPAPAAPVAVATADDPALKMTVAALKKIAKDNNVPLYGSTKKHDIISVIRQWESDKLKSGGKKLIPDGPIGKPITFGRAAIDAPPLGVPPAGRPMLTGLSLNDWADHFKYDLQYGRHEFVDKAGDTIAEGVRVRDLRVSIRAYDGSYPDYVVDTGTAWRFDGVSYLIEHGPNDYGAPWVSRALTELRAAHQAVPAAVKANKSYAVLLRSNPEDVYWQRKFNNPKHIAEMSTGGGHIKVWNFSPNFGRIERQVDSLRHETGHNLDSLVGRRTVGSESPAWAAAADADAVWAARIRDLTPTHHEATELAKIEPGRGWPKGVTQYGRSSVGEDYAESVMLYQLGPIATGRLPGVVIPKLTGVKLPPGVTAVTNQEVLYFRDIYPKRAAILDKLFPDIAKAQKAEIAALRAPVVPPDLSKMLVKDLRALAKERGVKIPTGAKKADIVALLKAPTLTGNAAIRAAARERNRQIEQATGTAKLLAHVDELLAKRADLSVIRQSLDPKLIKPEQIFANADAAILAALRKAIDTGDRVKLRQAITRASSTAKIKPISRAGVKVKFDPDTMEPFAGDIKPGTPVTVVRRGSSVTLPDGMVLQLEKARVVTAPTPVKPARPPAKSVPIRKLIEADDATIEAALRDVYEGKFGPYTTKVKIYITRAGTKTSKTGRVTQIDPSISVDGKIYDSTGREIGNFGRSIGPRTLHYGDTVRREVWAEHHIVQLEDRYQGKGFGGEFNRRAIDWYRASGVHGISQSDHNGYVWASQGFGFSGGIVPDSTARALRELVEDLRAGRTKNKYGETIAKRLRDAPDLAAQIDAAERLLARLATTRPGQPGYPTAYEMSQLGRTTQRGKTGTWLGKEVFVSADELVLNPTEGVVLS